MNTDILIEDIRLGAQSDNMAIADLCKFVLEHAGYVQKEVVQTKTSTKRVVEIGQE